MMKKYLFVKNDMDHLFIYDEPRKLFVKVKTDLNFEFPKYGKLIINYERTGNFKELYTPEPRKQWLFEYDYCISYYDEVLAYGLIDIYEGDGVFSSCDNCGIWYGDIIDHIPILLPHFCFDGIYELKDNELYKSNSYYYYCFPKYKELCYGN